MRIELKEKQRGELVMFPNIKVRYLFWLPLIFIGVILLSSMIGLSISLLDLNENVDLFIVLLPTGIFFVICFYIIICIIVNAIKNKKNLFLNILISLIILLVLIGEFFLLVYLGSIG